MVIGATILTAALIGASALVFVVMARPSASKTAGIMRQVADDSGLVLQDYGVRDYASTLQECSVLASAVKSAQAQAPIPDSATQQRYASALTAFASGAQLCSSAITQHSQGLEDVTTTVNHTAMTQALSQFSTGTRDLRLSRLQDP